MKRTLAALAVLACLSAARAADDAIQVETVLNAARASTNGVLYGKVIEIESRRLSGSFGLQLAVENTTGTLARVDAQVSNDGQYFSTTVGYGAVAQNVALGTNYYALSIPLAKYMRIRVVATNDGATVTGRLAYQ